MDAASKSLVRRRVAAETCECALDDPSVEALPLSGRTGPNVRVGSFATGSSQPQVRPCPLCRRMRKYIRSIGGAAMDHGGLMVLLSASGYVLMRHALAIRPLGFKFRYRLVAE